MLQNLLGHMKPVTLAADRTVPVVPALEPLLPGGLRRGSTVGVSGSTSLALALLAGASASGSWCAGVGLPSLGLVAAGELGVELERLALVPDPGDTWASVVAALVDALDVVLMRPPARHAAADARRLTARARERGSVIVAMDAPGAAWPGAEVRLSVTGGSWAGLGQGHGRLVARQVEVIAEGRGAAARPRRAVLWLPGPEGGVATVRRREGPPQHTAAAVG